MTVLVGVNCVDGVVLGADSAATSAHGSHPLMKLQTDKLYLLDGRVILAGTGAVGLGQRFREVLNRNWQQKTFQKPAYECLNKLAADAVHNFRSTGLPLTRDGFGYGAMIAVPFDRTHHLVEFSVTDLQPEIKEGKLHYATMGSGEMLADPFLAFVSRVIWRSAQPKVQDAIFGVLWTLQHTIKFAPGGVGDPPNLAVLSRSKGQSYSARLLSEEELGEHSQYIEQVEERIGNIPTEMLGQAESVEVPKPKST